MIRLITKDYLIHNINKNRIKIIVYLELQYTLKRSQIKKNIYKICFKIFSWKQLEN